MNTEISKQTLKFIVQFLSEVTSNAEPNRVTLQKVRARIIKGVWLLEATDGHRMVSSNVDATEIVTDHGESICFPYAYLDFLKSSLKAAKKQMDTQMINVSLYTLPCPKSDYPDTDSILPNKTGYDYEIGFNAEYLYEMLKAMRDNNNQVGVTLKIKGPRDPIIVTCNGSSNGLLMPMRVGSGQWGKNEESESVVS